MSLGKVNGDCRGKQGGRDECFQIMKARFFKKRKVHNSKNNKAAQMDLKADH